MSKFFHHELIDLYLNFLEKLNFRIMKCEDGTKYLISRFNKEFFLFENKQIFLLNDYSYLRSGNWKSTEIIFNPFGEDESNCSFLVLKDGVNSKLSEFIYRIFRMVIEKKLNINIEKNSKYTFDNEFISNLPSINKYTLYKWKNIFDIINFIPFSKDIISFSLEYSDNSQSVQVKFDYPLYKYLLQLQDNTIFGIKLSEAEIELFKKIYEILIIAILEKAFNKPIKVSINSDKFSKFYAFVKFCLVIEEQLYKNDTNLFWESKKRKERIENLNYFASAELEKDFVDILEKMKKIDEEAYKNELKIREESKPNRFLLKDNIMAKEKNLQFLEEINKKYEKEHLNTYIQKVASYFARKDAEAEIFNIESIKNNQDFQIILDIQRLTLQIIEGDGGLLFFDTRDKKYYFRSNSEDNIVSYDKKDIVVILNRAMQKNFPKYYSQNRDSSYHSIEVALIENLNDLLKEKLKNEINTSYVTKILIFVNQIPSIDGEVFDLSRNKEIFQRKTDLLFKRNIFVPTQFLAKTKEYNKIDRNSLQSKNKTLRKAKTMDLEDEDENPPKINVQIADSFIKKFIYQMVKEDAEKSDYIINWLAYYFQNLKKTGIALVLLGDSDVTEKLFSNLIIKRIFGKKYCSTINDNEYKTVLLQDIAKYKLFFNIADIKDAGTKFDDGTLALLVKDLLIQQSVEYANAKGEEEKVEIYGQLLITATNPAPYLKKSLSKCTVIQTVNIDKIMESLELEDETELEDKILKDLDTFSDLLNNYSIKDEIAKEKLITKEREILKGVITPNVDKEAIEDSLDKFIEAIKNKNNKYFEKVKDIENGTIYEHLKNAFEKDDGYFIGQDLLIYYNAVNEQKFDKKKDLMDKLKAKNNMFSQEVKTLKILTSDGKEEVPFQAYKTSKETGNKELYKINDYFIAKDIKIPFGSVITTSQDNIEKYNHPDLENAIKINKEYKDKVAKEKENK